MYRKKDNQTTLDDFLLPFGGYLLADNRSIIKAKMIHWDKIEGEYSDLFPNATGTVVKPARVAFGALIIKETLGLTDEETVEQIRENPYLQCFLGYNEYSTKKPFDPSLMVFFRKRFGLKNLTEITVSSASASPMSDRSSEAKQERMLNSERSWPCRMNLTASPSKASSAKTNEDTGLT